MVAISAMGALNANVFATAKLVVAGSHRNYFPSILANLHCHTARDEEAYLDKQVPWIFRLPVKGFAKLTRELRWAQSVPLYVYRLGFPPSRWTRL